MRLNKKNTYLCLIIYALITLVGRFYFESLFQIDIATSLALGIGFVSIPGFLLKKGVLNLND